MPKVPQMLWHERARQRDVVRQTELLDLHATGRFEDVPVCVRRPEHRGVELTVAVVVGRDRFVAVCPEWERIIRRVLTPENVPITVRRPPERNVGLAVTG